MRIEHEEDRSRFVARVEGGEAELAYVKSERVLDLDHTFVPVESRGKGVGQALAAHAFDYAREHDYLIEPTCPFVRAWLEKHPEAKAQVVGSGTT